MLPPDRSIAFTCADILKAMRTGHWPGTNNEGRTDAGPHSRASSRKIERAEMEAGLLDHPSIAGLPFLFTPSELISYSTLVTLPPEVNFRFKRPVHWSSTRFN